LIGDFHIHSKYSYDSIMEPIKILKLSKKMGYDIVSITDHNCIKGSLEAKKYEKEIGIEVVIGEEISTNVGDIIGLNINEQIISKDCLEVLDNINEQGGMSILPHPFMNHKNVEKIASKVDIIEIWNSQSKKVDNNKAEELSLIYKKPPIAGSDAHIYYEIGNAMTCFNDFFDFDKHFKFKYPKNYQKSIGYIIRDINLRKFYKIPKHLLKLFSYR
jgi:predicted metal-dependent phosphoesterase TrpH